MPRKKAETAESVENLMPGTEPKMDQETLEAVNGEAGSGDAEAQSDKTPAELSLDQELAGMEQKEKPFDFVDDPAGVENAAGDNSGAADDAADKEDISKTAIAVPDKPAGANRRNTLPVKASPGGVPATAYKAANFFETDFKRLDRDLSDPERDEWNAIYASFRSKSILTGTVIGVDENELPVRNSETKLIEMRTIYSLVIIGYRVKILIPENAVWVDGEERATFLMRGMIGATVDYVVTNVDREGECCLASRAMAVVKRRRAFHGNPRTAPKPGDIVKCSMLVVGSKRCLLTCGGYDVPLRTRDMSYTPILDMREIYRPGQEYSAKYLGYDAGNERIGLSVKLATPNPFIGAERRHPVGRRRQAVISGKYGGGVFCALPDGTMVLCLYSNDHLDSDFLLGDSVIVHIVQYDFKKQFIYGRIVSKW